MSVKKKIKDYESIRQTACAFVYIFTELQCSSNDFMYFFTEKIESIRNTIINVQSSMIQPQLSPLKNNY